MKSCTVEHQHFTRWVGNRLRRNSRIYSSSFCTSSWNIMIKELFKSVYSCQSYRENKSGMFLWTTVYNHVSISAVKSQFLIQTEFSQQPTRIEWTIPGQDNAERQNKLLLHQCYNFCRYFRPTLQLWLPFSETPKDIKFFSIFVFIPPDCLTSTSAVSRMGSTNGWWWWW